MHIFCTLLFYVAVHQLLQEIKNTCRGFSLKEMSSLSISGKDILHTFPHDIAIHYDDKGIYDITRILWSFQSITVS